METNNVKVYISIEDGDKNYQTNWTFTNKALEELKSYGLSRQKQITSLMIKMLQSEPATHLMEPKEVQEENEVITEFIEPFYSFKDYSLDPSTQLDYQKKLIAELDFTAGWIAPNMNNENYRVFIIAYPKLEDGRVRPMTWERTFKTPLEVDKFYDKTVKELLKLIDVN